MSFFDTVITYAFGTGDGLSLFLSICVGGGIVLLIVGTAVIENRDK